MDHPELAFGQDGDVVSVRVGKFGDQQAVDGRFLDRRRESMAPGKPTHIGLFVSL
jgi:hypothetical protein